MVSDKATTININTQTTKAGNTYLYIVIYDERLADFKKSKYLWISTGTVSYTHLFFFLLFHALAKVK